MTEWFEEWFGEEYLHLYPHRDEADAERLVELLCGAMDWKPGWKVLDVGADARPPPAKGAEGEPPQALPRFPVPEGPDATNRPVAAPTCVVFQSVPLHGPHAQSVSSFGYFERDEIRPYHQRLHTVRSVAGSQSIFSTPIGCGRLVRKKPSGSNRRWCVSPGKSRPMTALW
jgi:hypothetical protein